MSSVVAVKDQGSVDEVSARRAVMPTRPSRAGWLLPALYGVGLLVIDVALVVGAFLLAYWARFIVPQDESSALDLGRYLWMGLTVGLVTAVLFSLQGLYGEHQSRSLPARLYAIASAVSIALVLTVGLTIFLGDQQFSRLWFAAGWAFTVNGLALWRTLALALYSAARDSFVPANRVLIVGANPQGRELAHELAGRYQVVGYVDNGSDLDATSADLPLLGPIMHLDRLIQAYAVDELFITLPIHRREQIGRIITRGFRRPVKIQFLPDLGDLLPQRFEVRPLGGRSYIAFAPVARVSWIKRVTDLLLATVCLLAAAPVLAAVALAIKLDSPGPVFYRQRRIGKDGRPFWMYKFRSMCQDADRLLDVLRERNEATGPLFKIRHDPRITRVGRVLRRSSLDELPQLLNVVKGEMSLVGPRPPIPSEVEQYEDWQLGRLRAVPGITGLWQVSGRSEVPFQDMIRLDLHYIRNWSLGLDLGILLRTIPAVLTHRGSY